MSFCGSKLAVILNVAILLLQGCTSKSVSPLPSQTPDTLALRRLVHMLDSAKMYEYALDIERILTGENSPEYAALFDHLGNSSEGEESTGEYGFDTESNYTPEYIEAQTNHSLNYAYRQVHRADSAFIAGSFEFDWASEAIAILRDSLDTTSPEYARALSSFGDNYLASDLHHYLFWNIQPVSGYHDFIDDAISCYEEAIAIQKPLLGESHPDCLKSLFGLWCCRFSTYGEEQEQWKNAMREVLDMIRNSLGNSHPDYLRRLIMIGDAFGPAIAADSRYSYANEDAFKTAFGYYTEAISIMDNNLSLRTALKNLYITALIRVGTICEISDNTRLAIDYYSRAGEEIEDSGYIFHRLASCYYAVKDYSRAVEAEEKALATYQGYEDYFNLSSLHMIMGESLYEQGRYEEAIEFFLRTSFFWGKTNYRAFRAPAWIGNCYLKLGDYPAAILYYWMAMAIWETDDLDVDYERHCLRNLSICFERLNVSELAVKYFQQFITGIIQSFREELTFSQVSAAKYWDRFQNCFYYELPYYTYRYPQYNELLMSVYDGLITSKGFLLNAETELRKLILENGEDDAIALYDELGIIKETLDSLRHLDSFDYEEIKQLEKDYKEVSDKLVQKSWVYGKYKKNLSIGWLNVQSALGKRDIAIEFMEVPISADSTIYCALTLKKGYKAPHYVELFNYNSLDALKTKYARSLDGSIYEDAELYNLVWKPLEGELKGVDNIYFGPSAELYQIAIEYSYHHNRPFSDHKNIYRLSSTRQLAIIRDKTEQRRSAIFGGLDYDASEEVLKKDSTDLVFEDGLFDVASLTNRGASGELVPFEYLPGTDAEAQAVSELLQHSGFDNTLKLGEAGTESAFKALSGKQENIIHIATHGFYWDGRLTKEMGERLGPMSLRDKDQQQERVLEDASMTLSGLIFSGVNNALRNGFEKNKGMNDGILTANEITKLDFRGVDLLVLSACQTGLGEVSGEGVFGLQRGFKKAGVNSILMSLWEVDDEATQLLMTTFYENLTAGKSKRDALKAAQKTVRNNKERDFSSPYFWAAFILLDGLE